MMKHNNVTRILSCLLVVAMIVTLSACGRADDTESTLTEERQEGKQDDRKILIAYFTAAENSGVDAVSSADGGELIDYAAEEQDENARPELTSHIENPDQYDMVFVGFAGGIVGLN